MKQCFHRSLLSRLLDCLSLLDTLFWPGKHPIQEKQMTMKEMTHLEPLGEAEEVDGISPIPPTNV
jgi:hypothetical protein